MDELGEWRWYAGCDETDDEMMEYSTRQEAIDDNLGNYALGDSFYIVEARMLVSHEEEMASGKRDTAPFAETRNGEWVAVTEKGHA